MPVRVLDDPFIKTNALIKLGILDNFLQTILSKKITCSCNILMIKIWLI